MKLQEIKQSSEFDTFFNAAFDYCSTIELCKNFSEEDFLERIRIRLAELYSAALKIPHIEPHSLEVNSLEIDVKKIINDLSSIISKQFYWMIFYPNELENDEKVCGDLVDDLSDIYKDLKYSLEIYKSNEPNLQIDAIWQFKFDFETHWGKHCINALTAMHDLG